MTRFAHDTSKPIEDYALLGNGHTVALVARDGSVDWLCWPRFDSDACFAALLGTEEQGAWRIAPEGEFTSTRSYRGDTLVLDTEFVAEGGRARLTDFMPLLQDGGGALIRRLEGIEGELALDSVIRPRFGYGDVPPWWCPADQGWTGVVGPDRLTLRGPAAAIERDGDLLHTHIVLHAGETVTFVLQHSPSHMEAPAPLDPSAALAETENKWLRWIAAFDKATDWPHAVKRSLLTLKALTYQPTGGIVAAPTLGLPEKPAGAMNWDYRYGWLRDSTFTLTALLNAGFHGEARAWLHWLLRAIAGAPDKIRIMYRVDGGRRIDETELTHLPGWNGAKPVRLGNAAAGQRQLDVFGEVLDSALLADRAGIERDDWDRQIEESLVAHVECIWQQPDQGMWESRGTPQHYVYSKVMAWVAIDRLLRLDERHGWLPAARHEELEQRRADMHAEICEKGFSARRGTFMQHYGSADLDASLLLLPLVGFLPATDARMAATIAAIEEMLMEGGFVRRQEASWFGKEEGVFLACSCWLADCMAMQGRRDEARALFERVLTLSNDVGLLSEEIPRSERPTAWQLSAGADPHCGGQYRP